MKTIDFSVRSLLCVAAVIPLAHATIAPEIKWETPNSVTLQFATADARFNLRNDVLQSIDFHIRGRLYSAQFIGCTPLEHLRFDTAEFHDGKKEGSFTLMFQMGTEETRRFGELPKVQITFYAGRLHVRGISRKTGEHSWFTNPICPNDALL